MDMLVYFLILGCGLLLGLVMHPLLRLIDLALSTAFWMSWAARLSPIPEAGAVHSSQREISKAELMKPRRSSRHRSPGQRDT
jgi:hypothetical protein